MATASSTPALPPPTRPSGLWRLGLFGALIGLLTSLSTGAGTTAALIGLLFALVGGSFVSWLRPAEALSPPLQELLLAYVKSFSIGLLIGLFFGFGLRFVDQALLQPAVFNVQQKLTDGKFPTPPPKKDEKKKDGEGGKPRSGSGPVISLQSFPADFLKGFVATSREVAKKVGPANPDASKVLDDFASKLGALEGVQPEKLSDKDREELVARVKAVHKFQDAYSQESPTWGRQYAEFLYRLSGLGDDGK